MANKGGAFERELCVTLSRWFTGGKREDILWRTAGSGARATTRKKKGKQTKNSYGDICAIDPIGQPLLDLITFEIKRGYSRFTIADIFDNSLKGKTQLYEAWFDKAEQCQRNAGSMWWALIVKRDRREPLIFIPERLFYDLVDFRCFDDDRVYPCLYLFYKGKDSQKKVVTGILLSSFIEGVSPKVIIDLSKSALRRKRDDSIAPTAKPRKHASPLQTGDRPSH